MTAVGQLALLRFPLADTAGSKLRPVLVLRRLPGAFDDWLVCMVSSRLHQSLDGFDEVVTTESDDFSSSGLKAESVIRISRLAVVSRSALLGSVGTISAMRLNRIRQRLVAWLTGQPSH